jgi:hypothetical protein
MSEADNQNRIREHYCTQGYRLWRNNSGVLTDKRGIPVRFGLANDSKAVNEQIKSGDLIGWRTVTVTPDMVGTHLAVFVSIEVKENGWRFRPSDKRAVAQKRWADMIRADGGEAGFMIDPIKGYEA